MALVRYESLQSIGILTLNHPEKRNVLSTALVAELNQVLDKAEEDSKIRCLILASEGKAFTVGADIAEIHSLSKNDVRALDFVEPWQRISQCEKPIIAEINGYCLGGGLEIALMCDILVASHQAWFGQPEITLATLPGSGATQRLPSLIGKYRAMELCLTGRILSAEEAVSWGLIPSMVSSEKLRDTTLSLATKIASFSQPVIRQIKQLIRHSTEHSLTQGLIAERQAFHDTFDLQDQKEGMTAFLSRRTPKFQDC